jgi:rod shape determining protein RodA
MAGVVIQDPQEDAPGRAGRDRPNLLRLDPVLLLGVIALCVCSVTAIGHTRAGELASRQGVFFAVGGVVALLVSQVDYSRLRDLRLGVYALLIASVLAVIALGGDTRGDRRAIQLGVIELQTSELGKVLLIVALSAFLVEVTRAAQSLATTARIMLLGLVPTALVMSGDFGSALVYVAIAFALLFIAGTNWRHMTALLALGVAAVVLALVALPAAGIDVLKPEQTERLTSFLHPSDDPADAGYQQAQSQVAIGSGQRLGRGEDATQATAGFLPEEHTDFVFAVVGERYGFVGAALILSLYALLVWRGLRILTMAKNLYGALIAGGIVAMLLFQVFVNVGMNVGIMPITGIPLPLMSYGGSSVLTTLLAVGLLQSIHVQARVSQKGRRL